MDKIDSGEMVPLDRADDGEGQVHSDTGEAVLLTRMLLGLLLVGGEELLTRLQDVQAELEAGTELAVSDVVAEDATMRELLGYMAIGTFVRGQKRLSKGVQRGLRLSVRTTGRALGLFDRLTDNALGQPLRRPIEKLLWNLIQEGEQAVREGRREAHNARLLAGRTVGDITNDVIETIAENPELTTLIRRQVGQQSMGFAGTMVDNTRQIATTADAVTEGLVRRLLRRQSRRELPPSPLAGKPLDMYAPHQESEGAEANDR
jgi:hypothetical protein